MLRDERVDFLFGHLNRSDRPGAAVAVCQGAFPIFLKGYGVADLEQGSAVTPRTVFHVASVSKQFTAFATALLAREGKIDLEAPIAKYLPQLPEFAQRVTVSHLIHNTSGIRDQWELFMMGGHGLDDRLRQRQIMHLLVKQQGLNFEPGTDYLYSNSNFTLLAEIVRAASGQTLREFTQERVFRPLAMQRTFFYDDVTEIVVERAHSYEAARSQPEGSSVEAGSKEPCDPKTWRRSLLNYDNIGATSLHTTAEDLLKWAGNFARPVVGDAALIEQVCSMGALRDGTPINYGFGLAHRRYAGHSAIEHSGGDAGFRTLFVYFPESQLGVVLLANSPSDDLAAHAGAIADIYLNQAHSPLRSAAPPKVDVDPARVAGVVGMYVSEFLPAVTLEVGAKGLVWRVGRGEIRPIVCREDGTFDLGDSTRGYACYQFIQNEQGCTVGFENVSKRQDAYGLLRQTYHRIDPYRPLEAELQEVAGKYRSSEVDTTYELLVENGCLMVHSLWWAEPIVFAPSLPDRFDSDCSFMGVLSIVRGAQRAITGISVHGSRIRHIRLERTA